MILDNVPRNNSYFLTMNFFDQNEQPVQPLSATYRLDDGNTGQNVIEPVAITPTGTSYQIEFLPTQTGILVEANAFELRNLACEWQYQGPNGNRQCTALWQFNIENIPGITT
jgi:hypothetical protein